MTQGSVGEVVGSGSNDGSGDSPGGSREGVIDVAPGDGSTVGASDAAGASDSPGPKDSTLSPTTGGSPAAACGPPKAPAETNRARIASTAAPAVAVTFRLSAHARLSETRTSVRSMRSKAGRQPTRSMPPVRSMPTAKRRP